jgi:DNA-binding PadR family transcriptional regulator
MGRKPKKGLREAILSEASEQPSSASMIRDALESRHAAEPTTLTGIIKAAEGLKQAGLLRATTSMPSVYHGARPRTYYKTTSKGIASLKDAIASVTAGWEGKPVNKTGKPEERAPIGKHNRKPESREQN